MRIEAKAVKGRFICARGHTASDAVAYVEEIKELVGGGGASTFAPTYLVNHRLLAYHCTVGVADHNTAFIGIPMGTKVCAAPCAGEEEP